MRNYGAVGGEQLDRRVSSWNLYLSRKHTLLLCTVAAAALALLTLISNEHQSMLEEVNNLELNAYLSASQVQQFQHLVEEQKTISAATAGLLLLEKQMNPEDTKVHTGMRRKLPNVHKFMVRQHIE